MKGVFTFRIISWILLNWWRPNSSWSDLTCCLSYTVNNISRLEIIRYETWNNVHDWQMIIKPLIYYFRWSIPEITDGHRRIHRFADFGHHHSCGSLPLLPQRHLPSKKKHGNRYATGTSFISTDQNGGYITHDKDSLTPSAPGRCDCDLPYQR